jgi:ParB family chromosome partitioning protein
MKRKALGKGLRSLIPEMPPPAVVAASEGPAGEQSGGGLQMIPVNDIQPNKDQPRESFSQQALEELSRSIKRQGLLQPVIVKSGPDGGYDLIAGERRWRASRMAGLESIPAVIKDVSDESVLEIALIENLQREDLNPIEEANAYQALVDRLGLTQQEVAQRVGKQRATVANALRLLHLPQAVQGMVKQGQIATGHAKALAALADAKAQTDLAGRIARKGLSVRQTEAIVSGLTARSGSRATPKVVVERDPNVVAAEESLQSALGTKVRIVQRGKGGRLELHYFSDEELDRLYQMVLGVAQQAKTGRTE